MNEPNHSKAFFYISILLFFASAFLVLWSFTKGRVTFPITGFVTVPVEKDKAVWLQLPWQAMVTAIGGLIALREYNRSHKLKKDEYLQKEHQFVEKAQEDRFNDIQTRFASTDDKTRANAALRLAEIAQLSRPDAIGKSVCAENHPFVLRAASLLVIALHMEENKSVRAAIKEALQTIVSFLYGKEADDPLLHQLIRKLYDANTTAKRNFVRSLAEYYNSVHQKNEANLIDLLCDVVTFATKKETKIIVLNSLMEGDDFKSKCRIHKQTHGLSEVETVKVTGELLAKVQLDADCLTDTRDALAETLCALSTPTNAPKQIVYKELWQQYTRPHRLRLPEVFLVEARLNVAKMQKAYLWKAHLEGAYLAGANLEGAELQWANLQNAELKMASLQFSDLYHTSLQEVDLVRADLKEADLRSTYLFGSKLENNKFHADFSYAKWWEADFSSSNSFDSTLVLWLNERFPPNRDTQEAESFKRLLQKAQAANAEEKVKPQTGDEKGR